MKRTLFVTTPYGTLTRTTARNYSFAVVFMSANGKQRAMAWCGSHKLAEAQLRYWLNNIRFRFAFEDLAEFELAILPVSAPAD